MASKNSIPVSNHSHHRGGRFAAYLCIAIGIGLLVWIFFDAKNMLTHPVPGLALAKAAGAASAQAVPNLGAMGTAVASFVLRLLVLLIMTVVASLIASRGVHLYYVASAPVDKPSGDLAPAELALDDGEPKSITLPSRSAGNQ